MTSRQQLIAELKKQGNCTLKTLKGSLGLSENALRHHLSQLEREGFLTISEQHTGVGRPAKTYALSNAAEGLFPKRYVELLGLILEEAHDKHLLNTLIQGVVATLVKQLEPNLQGLSAQERLMYLLEHLDYGEMLGQLEPTEAGWELRAYNCVYRDAGCKFEAICDLLPQVINQATGLEAERPFCQRDGKAACTFEISRTT